MSKRLPASQRTRKCIDDVLNGRLADGGGGLTELVRLAVRLIAEEALEGEVGDLLGRGYYEHGTGDGTAGYRNGYRRTRLKTAEGPVDIATPQVAGTADPFQSALKEHLKANTQALGDLAVEMLARGLSTRDVEDAFRSDDGALLLSRTAVSRLGEQLWADYQAFMHRDLSGDEIVYLFVDGVAEKLRPGMRREPVLAAWGFASDGRKLLLSLQAGSKEDTETVRAFFQDLRARGLCDPVLVCSDGAPGICRAIEECFPKSLRQRCLAHKMRNLMTRVPEHLAREVKARVQECYQASSRAVARELCDRFVADFEDELPGAVKCFRDDFEACIAHLACPLTHRKAVRTTNLLERLFREERRRLKAVGTAFGEKPVLKLMFAAMIRAAERWRKIIFTDFEARQISALSKQLEEQYRNENGLEKTDPSTKTPNKIPSSFET